MKRPYFKFWLVTALSLGTVGASAMGVRAAIHSPLFLVRVVEVGDLSEGAPVDAQSLSALAAIPLGSASLFELDLAAVEARLMRHPWVKAVHLEKRFPQTVSVSVEFREPRALAQLDGGSLAYLDSEGKAFARVDTALARDLPVLEGFGPSLRRSDRSRILHALQLLDLWSKSGLEQQALLSSLTFEEDRGYRALITYTLKGGQKRRVKVDLGHEIDADADAQFGRLRQVLRYLADNGIPARQILTDTGKKIVVKITRGS
jgi:hypothetical protein